MQHEGEAFGGRERVEHDEQREPYGVREFGLVNGVGRADHRVGHAGLGGPERLVLEGLLAARRAGAQHVQADPPDDGRQPAAQVPYLTRIRPLQPQPPLLDGVLGLAQRTEHPVRHGPQPPALFLEPGDEIGRLCHEGLPCVPLRRRVPLCVSLWGST